MKRIYLLSAILLYNLSYSQKSDNLDLLIYLGSEAGKYNNDYLQKNAPDALLQELSELKNEDCQFAIDFTLESLKNSNDLLDKKYLTKPSKENLKQIFTISITMGFSLIYSGEQLKKHVEYNSELYPSYYDLVDTYYSTLFNALINRNREAHRFISDLDLEDYNLTNDTEKSIFYFKYMNMISKNALFPILANGDVTNISCSEFKKFPTINGKEFYYYTDFDFKDFPSRLVNLDGSYKHYYIDETFKILFMYIECKEKKLIPQGDISNIVENSILSHQQLYKFCERKDLLDEILRKYSN